MQSKLPILLLCLMLIPGLLYAAKPKEVIVINKPDVDANIVNEPTVHVGSSVDVNAHQAGEWSVSVENTAKAIKTFTGQLVVADGWVQVYQVPSGKRLVLTDIYLNQGTFGGWLNAVLLNRNSSANECGIGTSSLMKMHVRGLDGHDINYAFFTLQTGFEFVEGERICVAQSGGGNIFYNLSGYESDL